MLKDTLKNLADDVNEKKNTTDLKEIYNNIVAKMMELAGNGKYSVYIFFGSLPDEIPFDIEKEDCIVVSQWSYGLRNEFNCEGVDIHSFGNFYQISWR